MMHRFLQKEEALFAVRPFKRTSNYFSQTAPRRLSNDAQAFALYRRITLDNPAVTLETPAGVPNIRL